MRNSYSEAELKFFQKQIRSTNTTLQNLNRKGVSDNVGTYLKNIMGATNISNKGYFLYSMKSLKSLPEGKIEALLQSVDRLNGFIDLMRKSEDFAEAMEGNISNVNDMVSLMWNMYSMLQDHGVTLDSDQVRAITKNYEDLSDEEIASLFNEMKEIYIHSTSKGVADFDDAFNSIHTLRDLEI